PPERLFAEDVLAGFGGGDRRLGMERVRAAVVEQPDLLVSDDVVPVGRPPLVAIPERRLRDRILVPPGDRDEPWHERGRPGQVLHLAEGVRVCLPHECVTEHAHADLCHWRDSTPVSGRRAHPLRERSCSLGHNLGWSERWARSRSEKWVNSY